MGKSNGMNFIVKQVSFHPSDPCGHISTILMVPPPCSKHSAYAYVHLREWIWANSKCVAKYVHCFVHTLGRKWSAGFLGVCTHASYEVAQHSSKCFQNWSVGAQHHQTWHEHATWCCAMLEIPANANFCAKSSLANEYHQHC